MMSKWRAVLCLLLAAVFTSRGEFVGNAWPGDRQSSMLGATYIMDTSGPSIPYDGFVNAFHAYIISAPVPIYFQIWRRNTSSTFTLIGQQQFSSTQSLISVTVNLTNSIRVEQGDLIGFSQASPISAIGRYQTDATRSWLVSSQSKYDVGSAYDFSQVTNPYNLSLGVTLDLQPLSAGNLTDTTAMSSITGAQTTLPYTTVPVPLDRVYGHPEFTGNEWKEALNTKFVSLIFRYRDPIVGGYLTRFQLYSIRSGVALNLQIWKPLGDSGNVIFTLVFSYPYVTKSDGAFENTSVINQPIEDHDLIGFTVTDESTGVPVGRELKTGFGDSMYADFNIRSEAGLPSVPSQLYSGYQYINQHNVFALAAFVSNETKSDDNVNVTYMTMTRTTPAIQTSASPLDGELNVGNPDIVNSNVALESFRPTQLITMLLPSATFPRDGLVSQLSLRTVDPLADIYVGVYRKTNLGLYRAVYMERFNVTVANKVYYKNFSTQLTVASGDMLGFQTTDPFNISIGRIGVGSRGGTPPLLHVGPTTIGEDFQAFPFIGGYKYAIYAIMAAVPPTTTTEPTTTTTTPTTTTTIPTSTTTHTTTTVPSTTTTNPTTTTMSATTTTPVMTTTTLATTTTALTTTTTQQTTTTTSVLYVTGAPGQQGAPGDVGPRGPTGAKGAQGDRGANGTDGAVGPSGLTGMAGQNGTLGATGLVGSTGVRGGQGLTGTKGAQGTSGLKGDQGLAGSPGPTGATGPAGDPGATGSKGDKGSPGPKGDQGDRGSQGPSGDAGPKGDMGAPGEKGDRGDPAQVYSPIDECLNQSVVSSCGAHSVCVGNDFSHSCSCEPGYTQHGSNGCQDVNECSVQNGLCQQICSNTNGSRLCSCLAGYSLSSNKRTCADINECRVGTHNCSTYEKCFNEPGAFKCIAFKASAASARQVSLEALGGDSWWPLVTLGLIIWAALLSVVMIIVAIVHIHHVRTQGPDSYKQQGSD